MKGKTRVEILDKVPEGPLKKGCKGYIDGYLRGQNGIPYAVVVVDDLIDVVPISILKVITEDKPIDEPTYKYQLHTLDELESQISHKTHMYQTEGWELAGPMHCYQGNGSGGKTTYCTQPMKRKIGL